MMHRALAVLVLATSAACSRQPASVTPADDAGPVGSATASSSAAIDSRLPFAKNAEPRLDDVPTIVVDGEHVLLDGAVVGDIPHRLLKIDGEYTALKAKREAWTAAHANTPYSGRALLKMPRTTEAVVVKSVFQTAAFSGHPNLAFVVETGPQRLGRLDVDAQVPKLPTPNDPSPPPEKRLVVHLVPDAPVTLTWTQGLDVLAVVEVPWAEAFERSGDTTRAPGLAARLQNEWAAQGEHRDPTDKKRDHVVLQIDDKATLGDLIAALDAAYETKREVKDGGPTRAFDATFSVASGSSSGVPGSGPKSARVGTVEVKGRLPPEVIQRIVRGEFSRFRKCYEAGLGRNPKLTGRVAINFTIDLKGKVTGVTDKGSDLPDPVAVKCILAGFSKLSFPPPDGGTVTVVYPIVFKPED